MIGFKTMTIVMSLVALTGTAHAQLINKKALTLDAAKKIAAAAKADAKSKRARVVIAIVDGTVIGAIGVSGETPSQDEQIAKAGADAAKGWK